MPNAPELRPNERYAFLGKTRSGKTALGMVLSSVYGQALGAPWEIWWLDTKGSKDDLRALRKWGFVNGSNERDQQRPGGIPKLKYFVIEEYTDDNGILHTTVEQAQALIAEAYRRKHVIVVADEYTQVVPSDRTEGHALRNIFTRGGGLDVGIIGMTQEPVYIPRKLISQATHLAIFNLSLGYDIDYVKKLYRDYVPPIQRGDPHGFYWKHVDGDGPWVYFRHQKEWYDTLKIKLPKRDVQLMRQLENVE